MRVGIRNFAIAFCVREYAHLRVNAPVKILTMMLVILCLSACVCIFACFCMRKRKCECLNHNAVIALSVCVCVWACVNHGADASATAADLDVR